MLRGLGLPKFFAPQKVGFNIENISPLLMSKLQTLGFWNYVKPDFGIKGNPDYIGYRQHDTVLEDYEIINHLQDSWLTGEKLSISALLKNEIISRIYEIFVNAYGHGLKENQQRQSVISCGDYDVKTKQLSLSVLDFGGGIIQSVQKHTKIRNKKEAFQWALEIGNSTRTDSSIDLPRGLGFGILKDFVKINEGCLKICSDSFIATVDKNGNYIIKEMQGFLSGTLVSITINCGKNDHYQLK